jgi:spermidine synthase
VAVAIGDGRLLLNSEPSHIYDFLAIDAFSGDFIPTHLLTREAFELYFRVLKPEGILAIHISNKFLNLKPVIAKAAGVLGKSTVWVQSPEGVTLGAYESDWVLLGSDAGVLRQLTHGKGAPLSPPPAGFRLWTDEYSHVLRLLK